MVCGAPPRTTSNAEQPSLPAVYTQRGAFESFVTCKAIERMSVPAGMLRAGPIRIAEWPAAFGSVASPKSWLESAPDGMDRRQLLEFPPCAS